MKKAKKEEGKDENEDEEEGDSIESEEDCCNGKLLDDK